ncbi:hypothetical protein NDU88_009049 [Pleurodeles waltl]|uniref:Uncharacterized protein n=1 Tax=Pleurodeles waltl TaxID=8319 RepID=A0AAV7NYD6_PLEWA|nr:hypothetical protein NDU88_009049 [Pleurodeles waltl]
MPSLSLGAASVLWHPRVDAEDSVAPAGAPIFRDSDGARARQTFYTGIRSGSSRHLRGAPDSSDEPWGALEGRPVIPPDVCL